MADKPSREEVVLQSFRAMVPDDATAEVATLRFRVTYLDAAIVADLLEDQIKPTWTFVSTIGPYTERFVGTYDEAVARATARAREMAAYRLGYDVVLQRMERMSGGDE
jgi:hypothetical protein